MILVTELETGAVLAVAIAKKCRKKRKGTLALARVFCVFVLIDTHFLVLSLVDVCGGDNGTLLAGAQAMY